MRHRTYEGRRVHTAPSHADRRSRHENEQVQLTAFDELVCKLLRESARPLCLADFRTHLRMHIRNEVLRETMIKLTYCLRLFDHKGRDNRLYYGISPQHDETIPE